MAETNQAGQMLVEYVYLGDKLLTMIKPGEVAYYFHNDHLGTPQVLTNDSQAISWKSVYTPFGGAVPSIQTVENPFRFPGQFYDPETGLHYNYFRYYNPPIGRYITPDPIGLLRGINLFTYTRNNPLRWGDPSGLFEDGGPGAEYLGHRDFSGGDYFDYTLEDKGSSGPWKKPEKHFQDLPVSEHEVAKAIASCKKEAFERAMHRGQDYFTHYVKGYRWDPGNPRLPDFGYGHLLIGSSPDEDDAAWSRAESWTKVWVKKWFDKWKCCNPK